MAVIKWKWYPDGEWGYYKCPESGRIVTVPKEFVDDEMINDQGTFICPCCGKELTILNLVDFVYDRGVPDF